MFADMLSQLGELSPELLDDFMKGVQKQQSGEGSNVLSELMEFHSNKHAVPEERMDDYRLPDYVDFWDCYAQEDLQGDYAEFMEQCEKHSKKKKQLAADINLFLESVPVSYKEGYEYISNIQIQMVAAAIVKYGLADCLPPLLNLLRCEDNVISDCFMDDEAMAIEIYAQLCHTHLDDLLTIATDGNVHPFARGIAIGALARSISYTPQGSLLIQGMLRKVIDVYVGRAKTDRKVSVALIRATALCVARMDLFGFLPLLQSVYKKLRISGKGIGALSKVEKLMDRGIVDLGHKESLTERLENFLEFQKMFQMPDGEDYDDEDYDDEDYDDFDGDDFDFDFSDDDEGTKGPKLPEIKVSDIRNARLTNGKLQILGNDFVTAHPKGLPTTTDQEYIRFANGIVERLGNFSHDFTPLDVKTLAMKCTLYFEDVIADAGIWRSFVEKHRAMYGKPLPFHHVDEDDYYPDEPNLADVKLLVWLSRIDSHRMGVANPENKALMDLAETIYDYMDEMFEQMPVNQALADYFHKAEFTSDFFTMRDALKWTFMSSYLSSTTVALEHLVERANLYMSHMPEHAFYHAESTVIYDFPIGPLHLLAKDWLAMILQSNGKTEEAACISEIEGQETINQVVTRGDDLFGSYTIKRPDGSVMELSEKNFKELTLADNSYFSACMVKYHNDWYLSGTNSVGDKLKSGFDQRAEQAKAMKNIGIPNFDKLVKDNGGSQLFYFKDYDAMMKFCRSKLKVDPSQAQLPSGFSSKKKNWTIFLPAKDKGILMFPESAQYIKDDNNPFYSAKKAEADNLSFPVTAPYVFARYLMDHDLLPMAGFNHAVDLRLGRKQFHDNYDFVLRCLTTDVSVI